MNIVWTRPVWLFDPYDMSFDETGAFFLIAANGIYYLSLNETNENDYNDYQVEQST